MPSAIFNAASYFVDRHLDEGRGAAVAIECGDRSITYQQLHDEVNRAGHLLKEDLGILPEQRVLLLMLDEPEFVYAFFGAIKIGAVPVPLNTRWTIADYEYVLRDSGASAIIVSRELHAQVVDIVGQAPTIRHVLVAGSGNETPAISFEKRAATASPTLVTHPTHRDAPCFWLYSSGSTGAPKACVHLQHDMAFCADTYARGVLDIQPTDRCFSVARLFFAYGLGNAVYFPLAVGATSILWPGRVTPEEIYPVIERFRPTLFFSVPTHYAMLLAYESPGREIDLSS